MKIHLNHSQVFLILIVLLFANILMLGGTAFFHFFFYEILNGNYAEGEGIKYLLLEFSLANENTIATWYSSMLFLLVAVLFLLCFHKHRKICTGSKEHRLSCGWLIFSIAFVLLSLDEIASLHERIGNIKALNLFGDEPPGWISLLAIPILIVAVLMVAFFWSQVKRAPQVVVFAVLGIILFVSIPFQEYFEITALNAAQDREMWQRPVFFLLIEEGSEIFGALLLIFASLLYLAHSAKKEKRSIFDLSINTELPLGYKRSLTMAVFSFIFLAYIMAYLQGNVLLEAEGEVGSRRNWFPATSAYMVFLLGLYHYYSATNKSRSYKYILLVISFFSIFMSAIYGSDLYSYLDPSKGDLWRVLVNGALILFILFLATVSFLFSGNLYSKSAIILWAGLLVFNFLFRNEYSAGLTYLAFSFLALDLLHLNLKEMKYSGLVLKN